MQGFVREWWSTKYLISIKQAWSQNKRSTDPTRIDRLFYAITLVYI